MTTVNTPPYPHQSVVAVDFDATLVRWDALNVYHESALQGAREALQEIKADGRQVAIFTSRLDPTWLLESGNDYETQYNYIKDTLERLDIPFDFITGSKIPAYGYIDDKAITFVGNWPAAMASYRSGIDPYSLGWLAGIFQGEGSITFRGASGVELSVGMTDWDEVYRFFRLVQCGNVRMDNKHGNPDKPMYRWYVGNKGDVDRVLRLMIPLLGNRRLARALEALERMGAPWGINMTAIPVTIEAGTASQGALVAVAYDLGTISEA
jgi:hypothetical protein